METDKAAMSLYWCDGSLNIHVSVVEHLLTNDDKAFLKPDQVRDQHYSNIEIIFSIWYKSNKQSEATQYYYINLLFQDHTEYRVLEVFFELFTDKQKTADTILAFTKSVVNVVNERMGALRLIHIYTDGPSGQYKNRFTSLCAYKL